MPERFHRIENIIRSLPAVDSTVASGNYDNGFWWVKFAINIEHRSAWTTIKNLAYIINYLSISERFSTVFYPIASANSEPENFLSCIIETTSEDFSPSELAEWLESRMPDTSFNS